MHFVDCAKRMFTSIRQIWFNQGVQIEMGTFDFFHLVSSSFVKKIDFICSKNNCSFFIYFVCFLIEHKTVHSVRLLIKIVRTILNRLFSLVSLVHRAFLFLNYTMFTKNFVRSVHIPDNCDFRSQFDVCNIIFLFCFI